MGISTSGLYQVRMRFVGFGRRWTEKYFIGAFSNFDDPKVIGLKLVKGRCMILANGITVKRATAHKLDTSRDRRKVIILPVTGLNLLSEAGPPIVLEDCNNITACINATYETNAGKWNLRQWRGIRDTWVTGDAMTFDYTPFVGTPADADLVAGKTKEVALGTWLKLVQVYDFMKVKDLAVPGTFNPDAWANVTVDGVSHRDTGTSGGPRGRRRSA